MASGKNGMRESDLDSLLDSHIADAETSYGNEREDAITKALEYRAGEMRDLPPQPGRSKVVSRDVNDVIGWIMPSMLRVFLASDKVATFEPRRKQMVETIEMRPVPGPDGQPIPMPAPVQVDVSEERARQATAYINYLFLSDCDGYKILRTALDDGLTHANGIIKHWWSDEKEYTTEDFRGLTDEQFISLVDDDDIEVIEHTERPLPGMPGIEEIVSAVGPEGAALAADIQLPALHDVRIKRVTSHGRVQVEVVPGEEFLIERAATALDEKHCRFVAHKRMRTRSDLIKDGYDRAQVEAIESVGTFQTSQRAYTDTVTDKATEFIEVYECYVLVDYDGDGIAEWRKIVRAGGTGKRETLANDEWGDDLPFTDLVPDPVSHRWMGRSIFTETDDIQRIKTALLRGAIDNLYWLNNQEKLAVGEFDNEDDLFKVEFGAVHKGKPGSSITPVPVAVVADKAFMGLEMMDKVREVRTGIGPNSMSLDMDALQNQTATAVNAARQASFTAVETYARNIAEVGMKRLFRSILRLVVKNQEHPREVRLQGDWVEMDPRAWDVDMDVSINTGLGAGNRERDMMGLQMISSEQEKVMGVLGPQNPFVTVDMLMKTKRQMVETIGLRNPDAYFAEPAPEEVQAWQTAMQEAQQQSGQEQNPLVIAEMQKAQAAQMKAESDIAVNQAKTQSSIELAREKQQLDAQAAREKAALDRDAERERMMMEMQTEREKFQLQIRLASEEAAAKIKMARDEAAADIQTMREKLKMETDAKIEIARQTAIIDATVGAQTQMQPPPQNEMGS